MANQYRVIAKFPSGFEVSVSDQEKSYTMNEALRIKNHASKMLDYRDAKLTIELVTETL